MTAPVLTPAPPTTASPSMPTLWRCGGRVCPPGTCNHDDDEVQRHAAGDGPGTAPPIVHEVLSSSGTPLPPAVRRDMDDRLGHDFADVRIHTDARAAASAQAVQAHAYTVGSHVVFGASKYAPDTPAGRKLLLHELVHTTQRKPSGGLARTSLRVSSPADPAEQAAERIAESAAAGSPVSAPIDREDEETLVPPSGQLMRQADIAEAPPGLPCVLETGPGHPAGSNVLFTIESSGLSPAALAEIKAFVDRWTAAGSKDDVIVDGFASTDGAQSLNWRLSCDRAEAVKAELATRGVPAANITTFAHGESTEFSTASLAANRRAVISLLPRIAPPPPVPVPPVPPPPVPVPPAPAETVASETVLLQPGLRTRTKIGVGEQVKVTHAPGTAAWTATAGTLSAANGVSVTWTAPDTTQRVTVTGGAASITFEVLAPTGVHMDRVTGTGVIHTKDHADCGMNTLPFLLPDTVNFRNVTYHELNVGAVVSNPGPWSCFPGTGHCVAVAGACTDLLMTATVVAGKGTQAVRGDCVYSGDCQQTPPFVAGSLSFTIGHEYKVGAGAFRNFTSVVHLNTLQADLVTLTASKAGANASTTVASPTVRVAGCPPVP